MIRKMVAILKAVGFPVHDTTGFKVAHRGAGLTRDEYMSGQELAMKPDPEGTVSTNHLKLPKELIRPHRNKMLSIGSGGFDFHDEPLEEKPVVVKYESPETIGTKVPIVKRRGRPRKKKAGKPAGSAFKQRQSLFDLLQKLRGKK